MNTKGLQLASSLALIGMGFLSAPVTLGAQESASVITPGATVKKVQCGFIFTEGPAADVKGNVLRTFEGSVFTGGPTRMARSLFIGEKTGGANGLMFDQKRRLVVCEMAVVG